MNTSIYSVDELLNYLHNGTISSLPSEDILRIVEDYEKKLEDDSDYKREEGYNSGQEDGYYDGYVEALNAVERAVEKLKGEI